MRSRRRTSPGTFDSFINRFISRPLYVRYYNKTPRFIESWQDTKQGSFRLDGMDGLPNFGLDWFMFDFTAEGRLRATLKDDWIPLLPARHLKELHHRQPDPDRRTSKSTLPSPRPRPPRSRWLAELRRFTHHGNRPPPAPRGVAQRFGELLSNRFSEVIVDEAQDCGPEELLILRLPQAAQG